MQETAEKPLLQAGERVALLSKDGAALMNFILGAGWDASRAGAVDVDLSIICLDENGKVLSGEDRLLYYGQKSIFGGHIKHSGDNRSGQDTEGQGKDDERVMINIAGIPANCHKMLAVVNIYSGANNFGNIDNCFVRIADAANVEESLNRFNLTEDYSTSKCIIAGEFYRNEGSWKFKADGTGSNYTLSELVNQYS